MLDNPRKYREFPTAEDDYLDQDWFVPDDKPEHNQSMEELGSQENQPTWEKDEEKSPDDNDLIPLWDLL